MTGGQFMVKLAALKRIHRKLMMSMLCLGLAACAVRVSLPPARESLEPEINNENTKFFVFRRENIQQLPAESLSPATVQNRGEDNAGTMEQLVLQRVTLILQKTGYCREGFFELFRENSRNGLMLRGECREAANPQDRERFNEIMDVSSVTRNTPQARF